MTGTARSVPFAQNPYEDYPQHNPLCQSSTQQLQKSGKGTMGVPTLDAVAGRKRFAAVLPHCFRARVGTSGRNIFAKNAKKGRAVAFFFVFGVPFLVFSFGGSLLL